MSNRFKQAWDMACAGAFQAAAEMLFYGDNEDDYAISTQNPLYQNANFWALINSLGLGDFDQDDFEPGMDCRHNFQDADTLTLHIDVMIDRPIVYITLQGRTVEACLVIKQDPQTELFQLDDAFIAEKGNSIEDPEEYDIAYTIPLSQDDDCPDIASNFLSVFSDSALLIKSDTDKMGPHELEVKIFKKLKPIIDRINAREEQLYADYQDKGTNMAGPETGQPAP